MVVDWGMTLRKIIVYGGLFMLFMLAMAFLWLLGVQGWMIALLAGGFLFVQYFFSSTLVLWSTGTHIINEGEFPKLQGIIENLAMEMGLPKPRIGIMQNDMPNAFATGRDRKHAVVVVTTGILNRLNDNELQGVLAHEMTHVKNRDMFVVTFASFIVSVLSYIVYIAVASIISRDDRGMGANLAAWMISMVLSNTIGLIIINTVSRYREYGADRGSALVTKNPDWLISALRKISNTDVPKGEARALDSAKALCISPTTGHVLELFSTHPPIEKRIAQLEKIKAEMYGY
jgi:heat shock protein HtpX